MINVIENRLNLVIGELESGKTLSLLNFCANKIKEDSSEILYISNDSKEGILEKKFYSIKSKKSIVSINKENLKEDDNLHFDTKCESFEDIENSLNQLKEYYPFDYVIIDNINQFELNKKVQYKDRFKEVFDILNDFCIENEITIIISMYLLKMACWDSDGRDNFSSDDSKLGSITLVNKEGNDITLATNEDNINKYKLIPKNLILEKQ